MTFKDWVIVVLVGVLAVGALYGVVKRGDYEATIAQQDAVEDSMITVLDSLRAEEALADSAARVARAEADSARRASEEEIAQAREDAAEAAEEASRVEEELRESIPDSLQMGLDSLITFYHAQLRAKDHIIEEQQGQLDFQEQALRLHAAAVAAKDSVIARQDSLIVEIQGQRDHWRGEAGSWFSGLSIEAPKAAGLILGGYILRGLLE